MQDMDDQPGSTAILMKPAEIFAVRQKAWTGWRAEMLTSVWEGHVAAWKALHSGDAPASGGNSTMAAA